jgi:hypothetical protein
MNLERQEAALAREIEERDYERGIKREALDLEKQKLNKEVGLPLEIAGQALYGEDYSKMRGDERAREALLSQIGGRLEGEQVFLPPSSAELYKDLASKRIGSAAALGAADIRSRVAAQGQQATSPYLQSLRDEKNRLIQQIGQAQLSLGGMAMDEKTKAKMLSDAASRISAIDGILMGATRGGVAPAAPAPQTATPKPNAVRVKVIEGAGDNVKIKDVSTGKEKWVTRSQLNALVSSGDVVAQ